MKTIKQLKNVEKARILFAWFPDEIPAFLDTMQGMCAAIRENEAEHRAKWENGFFDFDFWLSLVRQAEAVLQEYGSKLHKSAGLFSDQLFDGYQALYSIHCLRGYATIRKTYNRDFVKAFDLFFSI